MYKGTQQAVPPGEDDIAGRIASLHKLNRKLKRLPVPSLGAQQFAYFLSEATNTAIIASPIPRQENIKTACHEILKTLFSKWCGANMALAYIWSN